MLLFLGDSFAAGLATFCALWLWGFSSENSLEADFARSFWVWLVLIPGWLAFNFNAYEVRRLDSFREMARFLLTSVSVAGMLYALIFFVTPGFNILPRVPVLYFIALVFLFTLVWRGAYVRVFTSRHFRRRMLIVGAGWAGRTMVEAIAEAKTRNYTLIGFIDDDPQKQGQRIAGRRVLGGADRLLEIAHAEQISDIILAITGEVRGETFQTLLDCQEQGFDIVRMPVLYEQLLQRIPINHLESDWIIMSFVDVVRLNDLYRLVSRALDVAGALVGLTLFLLALPLLALAIRLDSPGPIFYRQPRTGRGGREFTVWKLRTMVTNAEDGEARWAATDDPRITRVGKFLRRARFDEAPQFWNVLRSEMSLVGPRPERPEFVATLQQRIPFYRARLLVKPGITGWAQTNYKYGASIDDSAIKLQYDLYYIKHRSLWLDLLVLLRTASTIWQFKGT